MRLKCHEYDADSMADLSTSDSRHLCLHVTVWVYDTYTRDMHGYGFTPHDMHASQLLRNHGDTSSVFVREPQETAFSRGFRAI